MKFELLHEYRELKIGEFKIPVKGLKPEFMQIESDQQFTIKVDPNPLMQTKAVVAILARNLKPNLTRVPIHFNTPFMKFDDLIDIDVVFVNISVMVDWVSL